MISGPLPSAAIRWAETGAGTSPVNHTRTSSSRIHGERDIEFTVILVDMSRRVDVSRSECIGGIISAEKPVWFFQSLAWVEFS